MEAIAILAWLLEETQTFVRRRSVKRTGGSFGGAWATSGLSQFGQLQYIYIYLYIRI